MIEIQMSRPPNQPRPSVCQTANQADRRALSSLLPDVRRTPKQEPNARIEGHGVRDEQETSDAQPASPPMVG